MEILEEISKSKVYHQLKQQLDGNSVSHLIGAKGSSVALYLSALQFDQKQRHLVILPDHEAASYFYNDVQNILGQNKALLFPASSKTPYSTEEHTRNANLIQRTEVLTYVEKDKEKIIVTYPAALAEKVIGKQTLTENSFTLKKGEKLEMDFLIDLLFDYEFHREQFVTEPGQFAVRGGLIDFWSFSSDYPTRVEFFDDEIEELKLFDAADQISIKTYAHITITPNVNQKFQQEAHINFITFLGDSVKIWIHEMHTILAKVDKFKEKANKHWDALQNQSIQSPPDKLYADAEEITASLNQQKIIEWGNDFYFKAENVVKAKQKAQASFNKNFELLIQHLKAYQKENYQLFIISDKVKQINRLEEIFKDFTIDGEQIGKDLIFTPAFFALKAGFFSTLFHN